jgi:intein-encoded DNA endonuclease-like protein|nr:putative site-specific DNA endonuclease [Oedogonium sp. HN1801B]QUO99247.1 putative site-specific DNA endonuclease [Oedogonium sp. HN1801B]
MKILSVEQASYLAGFIDADGSIVAQIVRRKDYVFKFQVRVSVTCIQKMSQVHHLKEFQNEIGTGTVRDRGDGIGEFAIVGHKNVSAFIKQITPYLRNKKKQANLVLRICEQLDLTKKDPKRFLEICELSDRVSELNYSSVRINTSQQVREVFIDLGLIEK